jgi:tripartite-type tricarboxylate transporter receptor subunit TctC
VGVAAQPFKTNMMFQTKILLPLGLLLVSTAAYAQPAYPTRPIRMIIPFPAGGSIDTVGRVVAQPWGAALGQ